MISTPRTPVRNGRDLELIIDNLNQQFSLDIPNPRNASPSHLPRAEGSARWSVYKGLRLLFYNRNVDLGRAINDFDDWVQSRSIALPHMPGHAGGARRAALMDDGRNDVSSSEEEERLVYLKDLLDNELYLANGSFKLTESTRARQVQNATELSRPLKRPYSDEEEEDGFHTAPTSPVKEACVKGPPSPAKLTDKMTGLLVKPSLCQETTCAEPVKAHSKFVERLIAPSTTRRYDSVTSASSRPEFSFRSDSTSFDTRTSRMETSFTSMVTDLTEPMEDTDSLDGESIAAHMLNPEVSGILDGPSFCEEVGEARYSVEGEIMNELMQHGPFTIEHSLSGSVRLRYRYELERIGRAWNVPLNRMLVGSTIGFNSRDEFWTWIEGHNQRNGKPLPEKPSIKAWDAAVEEFKTSKTSEVVVLTGDLDWCSPPEPGILKLKLNPLKTDRTCRLHRRFGSDRFLSLTIPAPTRPPRHLRLPQNPTLLRESIGIWLTQGVHRCLGRTWKPFFVEEAKPKNKKKAGEPRFRVDFFAIDGIDFDHRSPRPPLVAPPCQASDKHTEMSLEALIEWHLCLDDNMGQSNCKLFQRTSLGLSKTFETVKLTPNQIIHLKDEPGRPVMNDGCALMSRGLAKKICDILGITGSIPSAFQGRIAGAKGLWMVDKHDSDVSEEDIWLQISDSQLKIKPHPAEWKTLIDPEKLTFEVVKWSKPLHPVSLNIQLLAILEHGGPVRERIAELTRAGMQSIWKDFAEVLERNCPILCRSLIQKTKPPGEQDRRMEDWAASNSECVIRLCEAGFKPRSFRYLRHRLRNCLRELLERYENELHIEVPLSTYAFCIADPYGVLKPDEVHFGFSSNWRDPQGQFEDNLLDGMDVLVARVPAHFPSDIQRVRAVWKPELRHFKDVIVFPTTGDVPLAHKLSGGDYDGDTPWVCWDQEIVQNFQNSDLPREYPPEHFGLTNHSVPMRDIQSVDEFLQSAITYNLTLSSLGKCTIEHERLAYDESIGSPNAMKLASLLSHLVDARKAGTHHSEQAWHEFRKQVSPRARELPAYKNPQRRPERKNIVDYLLFEVVKKEKRTVLSQWEKAYPQLSSDRDDDLCQPWIEAQEQANLDKEVGGQLHTVLKEIRSQIEDIHRQWRGCFDGKSDETPSFSSEAQETAERARAIPPPTGDHPLIHVWQHQPDTWKQLLASCAYKKYPFSKLALHAYGEAICQIKTSTLPNRMVTHDILATYRVNPKAVSRLTATDGAAEESEAESVYEGQEEIEAVLWYGSQGTGVKGGYLDPNDRWSVE